MNNGGELEYIFTTEGHLYPIKYAYLLKKNHDYNREEMLNSNRNNDRNVYSYHVNSTGYNDDYEYENYSANGDTNSDDASYLRLLSSRNKQCELKMSNRRFHNMRFNLPMKMRYFDQLFEMVGLNETVEYFLERKSNLNNQKFS